MLRISIALVVLINHSFCLDNFCTTECDTVDNTETIDEEEL